MATERAVLDEFHCWDPADRVAGRPAMTDFRRALRLHHARWRQGAGLPIGSQPIVPKPGADARPVGSRIRFDVARETGANFVTDAARNLARQRVEHPEPHQTFDHQRFWADLLWSPSLACNLVGDLAADPAVARRAVRAWWPDVPGDPVDVRISHSPGRFDPAFTDNLVVFDALIELDLGDSAGVLAIDVKHHEHAKREVPKPENRSRYLEVHERSGVFRPEALAAVDATPLTERWLEHLLLLSMLQHPSGRWTWGRYVVAHSAGNTDAVESIDTYRSVLADDTTFGSVALEDLLTIEALPHAAQDALRRRYVM